MHRTSIMLPDYLKTKVVNLAKREGVSLGQFIRESLEMRLKTKAKTRDCFFEEESAYTGVTPDDLAKNHDDYLY